MGIANRIINILVLIAAAAAIILGIMLFNKREAVNLSRQTMAEAIAESSNKLIKDASKPDKDKLTVSAANMDIKMTPETVAQEVAKLKAATDKVIAHQKKMSEDYAESVAALTDGKYKPDADAIAKMSSNKDAMEEVDSKIEEHNKKIEATRTAMKKAVRDIGKTLFVDGMDEVDNLDLTETASVEEFEKIAAKIDEKSKKFVAILALMTEHVKTVQTTLEKDELLVDVNTTDAKVKLEDQIAAVSQVVNDLKAKIQECTDLTEKNLKLTDERDTLAKDKAKLTDEKEELMADVKKLNDQIDAQKKEIADLKKKNQQEGIVVKKTGDPATLDNNELMKKVQGKITYVDLKTGMVVVDIGTKTQVDVKDAKGNVSKKPVVIGRNVIMTVVSSTDPEKAKFLGKIEIIRLGETSALANILKTPEGLQPVIGSVVYFSEGDFAAMRERNAKALAAEQQKPAAPAPAPAPAAEKEESSADVLNDGKEEPAAEDAGSDDVL